MDETILGNAPALDLVDLRERLDAGLEVLTSDNTRSEPRVFRSTELRFDDVLLEHLSKNADVDRDEALEEIFDCELDELLGLFGIGSRIEAYFGGAPGARVSWDERVFSFRLGDRGYLIHQPDPDVLNEAGYRVLGAWEPYRSRRARARAVSRLFWDSATLWGQVDRQRGTTFERLRESLERHGYGESELASILEVPTQRVHAWFEGTRDPSLREYLALESLTDP